MDGEELDLAVGLIIEAHGPELDRTAFDVAAREFTSLLGLRDRLWARYLLVVRGLGNGSFYQEIPK